MPPETDVNGRMNKALRDNLTFEEVRELMIEHGRWKLSRSRIVPLPPADYFQK